MNTVVDISKVTLKTKRLILRPWEAADLNDLYEYASVDGVGQMAGWAPHKSIEESKKILQMFIDEKKTFAVEYKGKVVGSLGIEKYNEAKFPQLSNLKRREIGYVLAKNYWGQGLMPEAVNRVIEYLFDTGLDAILCGHFTSNVQSKRVQEKCGFKHYKDGTYETQRGTIEDDVVNIIFKEEYEQR